MDPSHDLRTPPRPNSSENGQKRQGPTPDLKQKPREPQVPSDLEPRADASEERFREILESVHAIVWEADAATLRPTFVSQGAERILGFSPAQWLHTPNFWADHLHPEDRGRSLSCERETLEKGGPLWVEYRMERAGGGFRWFRDSMYLVKGPEGEAKLLRGIMVDITESKEAEEALRQSEQRYRDFIAQSSEGVWRLELEPPVPLDLPEDELLERFLQNAYIAECNLALARIVGASDPAAAVGRCLRDVIPPHDEGRMESFRSAARGRFQSRTIEFRALDTAGNSKDLLRTEIPIIENGLLVRVWGITRDVTERERAEEALRQSEQFNREVISNAQEGVIVYDRQFRYRVWNRFMEELTGIPAAQVLGKKAFDLFPRLREGNLDRLLRRALAGETVQSGDVPYLVPGTGKSGWVSATYGPHFGAKGEIVGVVGFLREISERKEAEEALRESEVRFRTVFENAGIGMGLVDMQGNSIETNLTTQRLLG